MNSGGRTARFEATENARVLGELFARCERIKSEIVEGAWDGAVPRKKRRVEYSQDRPRVPDAKKIEKLQIRACLDLTLPPQEVLTVVIETAIGRAIEAERVGRPIPKIVREALVPRENETFRHRVRQITDEIDRACRRKRRTTRHPVATRNRRSLQPTACVPDVEQPPRQIGLLSHPAMAWGCDSAFHWFYRHELPEKQDLRVFERALPCERRSRSLPDEECLERDPVPRAFWTAQAGTDWETARFCLETLLGIQNVPEDCNDNQDLSGLSAHLVRTQDWSLSPTPLGEQDLLKPGDYVVISRKPTGPRTARNPYVPLKFTSAFLTYSMTRYESSEHELDAFLEAMGDAESQNYHAPGSINFSSSRKPIEVEAFKSSTSERWEVSALHQISPDEQPIPTFASQAKPDYLCRRCGAMGEHLISHCPTKSDPDYVPFYAKRRPHGVPLDALVAVTDPKDVGRARYYANGQFFLHLLNPTAGDSSSSGRNSRTSGWEGGFTQRRTHS